jgi:hypothetical protein
MYSMTKYGRPGGRAGVEDLRDVRVVHHRQRLALVVEAGQHLSGVHSEFHNFESHTPANGLKLFRQVYGAHASFTKRSKNTITAEVIFTGSRYYRIDGLTSGLVRAERTIESTEDETLRAQSGGITGARFLSALRAVCHVDQSRNSYFRLSPNPCNFQLCDSLFVAGEPDWPPEGSI